MESNFFVNLLNFSFGDTKSSLNELDFLTELFSFFTEFDKTVSRQTCKWWNDLLSKDNLIVTQIRVNTFRPDDEYKFKRINNSCYYGYLSLVIWAKSQGCEFDFDTSTFVAEGGHLKIMKWFLDNGYHDECTEDIFVEAAYEGNLKVLKWFNNLSEHIPNSEWKSSDFCMNAAANGQLETIKWFRKNGFGWDERTCYSAAMNGFLEVLIWCRENGCVWDVDVCLLTRQNNREMYVEHQPHIQAYIHSLPFDRSPCDCPRTFSRIP
jgi:hypothetical protein